MVSYYFTGSSLAGSYLTVYYLSLFFTSGPPNPAGLGGTLTPVNLLVATITLYLKIL